MRKITAELLDQTPQGPLRKITVMLDSEQMELVEKLSCFLSSENDSEISTDRIIEQAVRTWTTRSTEYIAAKYEIDIRSLPLSAMKDYSGTGACDTAICDTIVLPVKDTPENRQAFLEDCRWSIARIDRAKLNRVSYVAVYWGAPSCCVQHYARLISAKPSPADPDRLILSFEPPEELLSPVKPRDPSAGLRRSRYTTLSMLIQAHFLEDLFS